MSPLSGLAKPLQHDLSVTIWVVCVIGSYYEEDCKTGDTHHGKNKIFGV